MSRVLLVRHGKAAERFSDYDHLSEAGAKQAEYVGARLLEEDETITGAYHGRMSRQRATAEVVASVFAKAARPLPALRELPGLDEIAPAVLDTAMNGEPDPGLRERVQAWMTGKTKGTPETHGWLMNVFHRFARGEIAGDFETFAAFNARVVAALTTMLEENQGTTAVAFTSAGIVATAAGLALDAPLEQTLQLMATMDNGSVTELRHSRKRGRFSLIRLNDIGHVPVTARTLL